MNTNMKKNTDTIVLVYRDVVREDEREEASN